VNILSHFKHLDMYGYDLHLNYKGEESVKTYVGALLTVFGIVFIGSLVINKFISLI
jgi:hypothetical protein